jgi:dehydrogenase/reductase SDR family protein 7
MDWIYLLGLLLIIYSVVTVGLLIVADCDIVTYLYSRYGKQPESVYKGKVVWITGASSGIGEALAKELVKVGAKVVISARRKEELERVKKECLDNYHAKEQDVLVLPLDVTNLDAHEPSFKTVLKHFGKLDVLLCNAGQPQFDEFTEIDMKVDRQIFEINVFAVVNMSRIVVKYFLKSGGGQVTVISSLAAKLGSPFLSSYAGSKSAIHGYFNTLRMETYGKNIDVNIVCPGPVTTPIFSKGVTNKDAEFGNIPVPDDTTMMTAERCAYLSLISMGNRLGESWVAPLPIIPFLYIFTYFPLLAALLQKVIGNKMTKQMREKLLASKGKK